MDRTTLTANLKPLERRRLVATAPDPKDGRARLLRLTPAGRAVLAKAVPIWRHIHEEIEMALSDPDHLRSELNLLSISAIRTVSPDNAGEAQHTCSVCTAKS